MDPPGFFGPRDDADSDAVATDHFGDEVPAVVRFTDGRGGRRHDFVHFVESARRRRNGGLHGWKKGDEPFDTTPLTELPEGVEYHEQELGGQTFMWCAGSRARTRARWST